ncbi:hypothetical protein CON15_19565 [Bacillus cereus]|uniref:Uncharacterized protein n=1 Tax=Bacillus thuringiensis TaxID=1428 RepID=A0AB36VG75_BACTU|nr:MULTISPECIES: hypothetical protein [Bacillus cereus group]PDZ55741.1 hypothetical protein CON15_19565 [Bacillus cereus]PES54401.1 hypothetical protein CN506_20210 [Bacillus thuringiensis]PFO26183.1 hypothetical protein COJ78_29210 [Bacillus thuringiensis]PFS40361.1 hypothetical protein COK48_00520 [Bacillus thuringiensis]PFS58182.1 hypothetical protein COK64_17535 [Bacillus thuringiensis]
MEIDYWEKQLILYTKGHFKRINYKKDIKHFAANLYGLNLEQVSTDNVLHMVLDIYENLCLNDYIEFNFKNFISDLFKNAYFTDRGDKVDLSDILNQMLSQIQNTPVVRKGLNLGEVDKGLFEKINADIR